MTYKITPRIERLVRELGALAKQINPGLLASASHEARAEWWALRRQWPSEAHLRLGTLPMSEDALDVIVGKVRRFKTILEDLEARPVPTAAVVPAFSAAA